MDEAAVAEALDAGRLWGYGADVFTVEPPPPGHPLIGRPDVMLTPHSAAQTEEGLRNMATTIAQEVVGVLQGEHAKLSGQRPGRSRTSPAKARVAAHLQGEMTDHCDSLIAGGPRQSFDTSGHLASIDGSACVTFTSEGSFSRALVRKSTKTGGSL